VGSHDCPFFRLYVNRTAGLADPVVRCLVTFINIFSNFKLVCQHIYVIIPQYIVLPWYHREQHLAAEEKIEAIVRSFAARAAGR
jgi:hypothetical protein